MQVRIEDLDASATLVELGVLREARDRAERQIFLLAAHFADLHNGDRLTAARRRPGGPRAVQLAGAGTPLVLDLAIADCAAELHLTTHAARALVGDALEARHRLPRLWRRVQDGEALVWLVRKVAAATRDLTADQAATVDTNLATYVDGRLPYGRFAGRLEAEVIAADPEAAADRERARAAERFARVGQSNDHGQKTLYVKTSAAEMTRIDATIAYLADALRTLGDRDCEDLRRTKAVLLLANPAQALRLLQTLATHATRGAAEDDAVDQGDPTDQDDSTDHDSTGTGQASKAPRSWPAKPFHPGEVPACPCRGGSFTYDPRSLLPQVTLYIHLHKDTIDDHHRGVARWEGEGPISATYVRDFLGPQARFTIKPVIDPAGLAPVDAYETPERHREALHLRTPADVFPFASNTRRGKQADHTIPYQPRTTGGPPGQTGLHNLGNMTAFHHRVKTHTAWQVRQPFPGIYLWKSPHGSIFLVDHTGTRQVTGPDAGPSPSPVECSPVERSPVERHFRALLAAAA